MYLRWNFANMRSGGLWIPSNFQMNNRRRWENEGFFPLKLEHRSAAGHSVNGHDLLINFWHSNKKLFFSFLPRKKNFSSRIKKFWPSGYSIKSGVKNGGMTSLEDDVIGRGRHWKRMSLEDGVIVGLENKTHLHVCPIQGDHFRPTILLKNCQDFITWTNLLTN
jgi:hypothetical protein